MTCSLCDLPTPADPITAADVDGSFCCPGCLAVARRLDGVAEEADDPASDVATGDPTATGTETFLTVEGMHCHTCETFLEAIATDHPAVADAQASYPAGTVRLVHDDTVDAAGLASALEGTGYAVRPMSTAAPETDGPAARLLVGGFFGMMTMLWYVLFLYPAYLGLPQDLLLLDLHGNAGLYVLANTGVMATVVLGYTGYPILRGAVVSLRTGQPNMDLLVALAAGTAYLYSAIALVLGSVEVYFDITVAVVLVVTLGQYYKGTITDRAAGVLETVTRERVSEARQRTAEGTESVPVDALAAGDEVVVKAGERIPVDGTVAEGRATVDESLITGESLPETRTAGEAVIGGAEVSEGAIVVTVGEASRSTLDRVVRRLWTIQTATPGVQRLADRIAVVFVPLVILLAVGAAVVHGLLGAGAVGALLTGLTVLIVSCPCALGLATPLSIATATRTALGRGIAVLDESVFERASAVDVVAFDKTGTLTTGEMRVREVLTGEEGVAREGILTRAAALETLADHPVADAITAAAPPTDHVVTDLDVRPGAGVVGEVSGDRTVVGSLDLMQETGLTVPDPVASRARVARAEGLIPVCVGWGGTARGVILAGDEPRADWEPALRTLGADRSIVVITGDRDAAADRLRAHEAIDEVFAEVPPEGKAAVVEELRTDGTVAMVGDGTNDAPALAAADLGIALSSGTALAADAADVVITSPDLERVGDVFALTRAARRRIRQNLGWAFCYNGIAVPLAIAGVLNPLLAAVAMTTSSLLVVANSARSL